MHGCTNDTLYVHNEVEVLDYSSVFTFACWRCPWPCCDGAHVSQGPAANGALDEQLALLRAAAAARPPPGHGHTQSARHSPSHHGGGGAAGPPGVPPGGSAPLLPPRAASAELPGGPGGYLAGLDASAIYAAAAAGAASVSAAGGGLGGALGYGNPGAGRMARASSDRLSCEGGRYAGGGPADARAGPRMFVGKLNKETTEGDVRVRGAPAKPCPAARGLTRMFVGKLNKEMTEGDVRVRARHAAHLPICKHLRCCWLWDSGWLRSSLLHAAVPPVQTYHVNVQAHKGAWTLWQRSYWRYHVGAGFTLTLSGAGVLHAIWVRDGRIHAARQEQPRGAPRLCVRDAGDGGRRRARQDARAAPDQARKNRVCDVTSSCGQLLP